MEWIVGGVGLGVVGLLVVLYLFERSGRRKADARAQDLDRELQTERDASAGLRLVTAEKERRLREYEEDMAPRELFERTFGERVRPPSDGDD